MGFLTKLLIGRDDRGYATNEIPWPDISQNKKIKLAPGTEETIAVPNYAYRVKFSVAPGGIVWCGFGSSSLVLAGGTFTNEQSELNPILRPVFDSLGDRISTLRFISENDTFLGVTFYSQYDNENF